MISGEGLNFFDVLLNVNICSFRKGSVPLLPDGANKMYTPGTLANLQRSFTKMNKNGATVKSKNFSGTSETRRHLKTCRIISNDISIQKIFFTFRSKFFQIFLAIEGTDRSVLFKEIIAYEEFKFY